MARRRTRKRIQCGGHKNNELLMAALKIGDDKWFAEILKRPGVDPSYDNNYAMKYAAEHASRPNGVRFFEIIKLLLLLKDKRVDPSKENNLALRKASEYGQTDIIELLLQDPRVDPSVEEQSAIRLASEKGHTEIVKLLLKDKRVDPSVKEQSAIRLASKNGYTDIMKLLLQDPRVDPSVIKQNALKLASQNGHIEIVELLLQDPRVDPSVDKQFVLKQAVHKDKNDILRILLKHPKVDPSVDNQYVLLQAVTKNNVEAVRELLIDKRVDPGINIDGHEQAILHLAIEIGDPNMIKLLLLHPKVDPTIDNQFAIWAAVASNSLSTVQAVLQDPRVDPTVSGGPGKPSAIELACLNRNKDLVGILLQDPRVNKNPAIFKMARDGKFSPEINTLVLSMEPDKLWEGFSRADMEKLDTIFSEDANNYSCCPVCMRYVQRGDGCMYMSHNCYNEPGADTVDDFWYNMYKSPEGLIYWCTICGRICLGHRHYKLGATSEKLQLEPVLPGSDPFAKDCAREGGGGIGEKMMRFAAFRELAYELQKEVGKLPRRKALEELVQEMWAAPISRLAGRRAKNNLAAKKFRLSSNLFPSPVASNNAPNILRNAKNAKLLPTVAPGYNTIGGTDDDKVIQFHHREKNGRINNHEDTKIGIDSFENYIQTNLNDGKAGPCWLDTCTAIIHPDEIKELVRLDVFPDAMYKRYKDAFNRVQKGGRGNILHEAENAKCVIWTTKKNKNTTRRNKKVRGGTKRRR